MAEVSINSDFIDTVIGAKTQFKGSVNTDKPIKIAGRYEGTITSTNVVVIDSTGYFNGTLNCKQLEIIGEAEGNIVCTDLLKFADSGKFRGDVKTPNIDIHPGVDFDGTLKITK